MGKTACKPAEMHVAIAAQPRLGGSFLRKQRHWCVRRVFFQRPAKPFRYFDRRHEVLGYARQSAAALIERAQAFASPSAWAALEVAGVASKPMPEHWRQGQPLHIEVLVCPVSRKDGEEKDIYLRALDRLGEDAPPRAQVYCDWFLRQWEGVAHIQSTELLGMGTRSRLLRRNHASGRRLRIVERPQALFAAEAVIADPERFAERLARGIGRHRAFGFGMVLLAPAR
ncbi:CRISPR-associated protein Cas6/Cse3/CasE [Tepidimonas thermarum]|uniref:CRISPR-associated protein Cas6/Cse3/CasE n=1 Tax=Tepidimonas thermarum TaxID=335431 RepID=A0A554WVQ6_9BURK